MNRCCDCNKFQKWEDLRVIELTPDTDFEAEYATYICGFCDEKRTNKEASFGD